MHNKDLPQDPNYFDLNLDDDDDFNPETQPLVIDFDDNGSLDILGTGDDVFPSVEDEGHLSGVDAIETIDNLFSDDTEHWHQQSYSDTCAIASQEFILDELGENYGIDFTEEQLRQEAIDNGWYIPGGGTPIECMGNLIEAHGIEVENDYGYTLADLSHKLDDGQKVLVALDSHEIRNPGMDNDDPISNYFGIPGQGANHAVQVVGIDDSDPNNPIVILNDPGTPNGQGLRVRADDFVDAWEDSDYYMVSTTGNAISQDYHENYTGFDGENTQRLGFQSGATGYTPTSSSDIDKNDEVTFTNTNGQEFEGTVLHVNTYSKTYDVQIKDEDGTKVTVPYSRIQKYRSKS